MKHRKAVGNFLVTTGLSLAFLGLVIDLMAVLALFPIEVDAYLYGLGLSFGFLGIIMAIAGGMILPPHREWWRDEYYMQLSERHEQSDHRDDLRGPRRKRV